MSPQTASILGLVAMFIVATALPLSFQPKNGLFLDLLAESPR